MMWRAFGYLAAGVATVVRRISCGWWPSWRPAMANDAAFVWTFSPVVNSWCSVATGAAAPELGVELFEHSRRNLGYGYVAECRIDVAADVHLVGFARGVVQLLDFEPLVDDVSERCVGLHVPLLVHLGEQPGQDALGFLLICGGVGEYRRRPVSGSTPA
jgi:hypothetical protein